MDKRLQTFFKYGFVEHSQSGDQIVGECVFCSGARKPSMYVNQTNLLWDCKRCGKKGNFETFLEEVFRQQQKALPADRLRDLAINRGLPSAALSPFVGWSGEAYTLLVRDHAGKPVDLRSWLPKLGMRASPGCRTGLFGHEQLSDPKRTDQDVYICEGEWDAIALRYLLQKLGKPGIVVGVPGADTFKKEWIPSFMGRRVVCLYDADAAGESGEVTAKERLTGAAKSLRFVHWPADVPSGFDTRDWVKYGAIKKKTPRACFEHLLMLVREVPRTELSVSKLASKIVKRVAAKKTSGMPRTELEAVYKKWLHLKSTQPLEVMFGTVLANQLDGDPVWVFMIAPPGGMKSELLMSLSLSDKVYACSSLTPHALVSGANWAGGQDPSLMPRLDKKVLIIKDFTTTLSMNAQVRDEIFGQLRDSYDGKFQKFFGNGVVRNYESKFGILAGVTPNIDAFSAMHQGLGERFLKYRLERTIHVIDEEQRIHRALSNINKETSMRDDLQKAAHAFLESVPNVTAVPIEDEVLGRVVKLSMFVARMRGVVNRDVYNSSLVHSKASHEVGTRIAKQLMKLGMGVARYRGDSSVGMGAYAAVLAVALSSIPDKVEDCIRVLYQNTDTSDYALRTKEVFAKSDRLTLSTVFRTLQDLYMLGAVKQLSGKESGKCMWSLSDEIRELIKGSGVYKP